MTTAIDGAAGLGSVNDVQRYQNPVADVSEFGVSLSNMAEKALSSIGNLSQGFDQSVLPAADVMEQTQAATAPDSLSRADAPGSGDPLADATKQLAQQIEDSMAVQSQLTEFVMASSISSSLGRNLNMFLRGQ